jgi:hypothetical protein
MRFILPIQYMKTGFYVHPATHAGTYQIFIKIKTKIKRLCLGGPISTDPNAPIYGTRMRLKASFDPTTQLTNKPPSNATIAVVNALKKYGMFLADGVCGARERGREK